MTAESRKHMEYIFSGTIAECFEHYAKSHMDLRYRKAMADYTGTNLNQTVRVWFTTGFTGVGENLIKIRFLFELLGYDVVELHKLDAVAKQAGRLLACGIVELDELIAMFGFTCAEPRNQIFRVLLGKIPVTSLRKKSFSAKGEELLPLLELGRTELLEKFTQTGHPSIGKDMAVAVQSRTLRLHAPHETRLNPMSANEQIISSLAHQVSAMLPLAKFLLSDECSAEDRKRVRELSGGDGVFKLSNLLNSLCSEKARGHLADSRQQERR